MKVYSPSDIAALVDIKVGTLRKYSILLEGSGYEFQKNNRKQRYYTDEDVITIRKFITLKNNGMTLEEASKSVVLWHKGNAEPNEIQSATDQDGSDMMELKKMIHKQYEIIKEFGERLDKQQKYLDQRLEERDRVLMKTLNERLDAKKQITATHNEDNKQGFWNRLFRRSEN